MDFHERYKNNSNSNSVSTGLQLGDHERRLSKLELVASSNNKNEIMSIASRLSMVESKFYDIGTKLSIIDSTMADKRNLDSISSKVDSLGNNISSLSPKLALIDIHTSEINEANTKISSSKMDAAKLSSKVENLEASQYNPSVLEAKVSHLNTNMIRLENKLNILESNQPVDLSGVVAELSKSIDQVNSDLEEIDKYIVSSGLAITSLETKSLEHTVNLSNAIDRITVLEETGIPDVDLSPVTDRIDAHDTTLADHTTRIAALELGGGAGEGGDVDLKPITDQLDTHATTIEDHGTQIDAHDIRITALELGGGGGEGGVDLTPVLERLATVETTQGTQGTDIETNTASIGDHETRIAALEAGEGGTGEGGEVDLKPITDRLDAIETTTEQHGESIGGLVTGLTNVDTTVADHTTRIEALELGGGAGGEVDLTPIIARVAALEDSETTQDASIGTLETRVDALESGTEVVLPDTVMQTNKACTMTEPLTMQSKPIIIKDDKYPRFELWTNEENADTGTRYGSLEYSGGKFALIGKDNDHHVISKVIVPHVGGNTSPANLISDKCEKFTDLETRVDALEAGGGGTDTALVERIEDVEAGVAINNTIITGLTWGNEALHNRLSVVEDAAVGDITGAVKGVFHSNEDNTVNMVEDGDKLRINFKASNFLANNLRAGTGITLTPSGVGENFVTISAPSDVDPTPTKWYVLPLAGQSNMMGTGERDMPLENIPRLKQLASLDSPQVATESQTNVTLISSNYGDRFREFRPVENTNLTLIPATPCLDGAQNKFFEMHGKGKEGGQVSVGLYIAKAILPYIPSDYGIIIVDGSTGSSGFGDQFRTGTYNSTTKRANLGSDKAAKWAANTPLDKQFRERVKHCLDLNPENKLLPVIWCQGENDVEVQQHYTRAKEYFKHLRTFFTADETRLPKGLAENFRIICYGTTRKMLTQEDDDPNTRGRSIHDFDIDYRALPGAGSDPWGIHNFINSRSNFDNYAHFMEDPEFLGGAQKRPQVIFVRTDIDRFGKFTETADEEGVDQGGALIGYSADWHFATNTITNFIPSQLLNAIGSYTDYLYSPFVTSGPWARQVRGKFGLVHTDNINYVYDNSINDDMSAIHSSLAISHAMRTTPSTANGTLADGITVSTNYTKVSDSKLGQVGSFDTSKHATYTMADRDTSFTMCISFKDTSNNAENTSLLLTGDPAQNSLRIEHMDGSWMFYPKYKHGDANSTAVNFMLHKHLHGGWKGSRGDWQHIAVVYNKELSVMHFYVNGCLVESLTGLSGVKLSDIYIGKDPSVSSKHFKGLISNFRLHTKALSRDTINTLVYSEMGN